MRILFVMGLLAFSTAASAQTPAPSVESVREQLRDTETRSFQLARLVSSHLDQARVNRRRGQARCLDRLLSQIHAVGRRAAWQAEQAHAEELQHHANVGRVLSERLHVLRRENRRCLGTRARQRTQVTVEIAPWVPRDEELRLPPSRSS